MSVKSLIDFFNPYKEVYSLSAEKKESLGRRSLMDVLLFSRMYKKQEKEKEK